MHLVVHVPVWRGTALAVLVAGGDAEIVAIRHPAMVDLNGALGAYEVDGSGQWDSGSFRLGGARFWIRGFPCVRHSYLRHLPKEKVKKH